MFDQHGYENYVRAKVSLELALDGAEKTPVNIEINTQMHIIEERILARIKQAHYHASQEFVAMTNILRDSSNPARV